MHDQAVQTARDLDVARLRTPEVERHAPGRRGERKSEPVLSDERIQNRLELARRQALAGVVHEGARPAPARNPLYAYGIGSERAKPRQLGLRGGLRCVAHHENTCRTAVYSLTTQDFSNYIAAMDQDLSALEDRVRQVAELCQQLRAENSALRQRMARLTSENKSLADKINGAKDRLQGLLDQLPE